MAVRHKQDLSKSPSKNLAHVPCKFFKQGACQAGNSCPFSHTVDAELDSTPCKYFQKGNCKFGVKCALAHILPDGRRVNPRTLAQVYQNHNITNSNGNSTNNGDASVGSGIATGTGINGSHAGYGSNIKNSTPAKVIRSPSATTSSYAYSSPSSFYTSPPRTAPFVQSPSHQRSGSIWSPPQSASTDRIPLRSVSNSFTHHAQPGLIGGSYHAGTINESAIADDDDDNDDVFEEDFVPSSLSDLLTPQERERRNSRPSFSRPSIPLHVQNQYQNLNSPSTSTEVVVDPDETETQFKMDDDDADGGDFELKSNIWNYNGINAGY